MNTIVTSPPRREIVERQTRIVADVAGAKPLWFSVESRYAHLLSDRADHVAVALLLPAMQSGRALHVGGTVTDTLLHQVNGDLQNLLMLTNPGTTRVAVSAEQVAEAAAPADGVATGFSGGVDSLATVEEYFWRGTAPRSLHITHLVNNNVGAHGTGGRALWEARCRPLQEAAESWGLPFVRVDSNLDEHYPRIGFLESVTLRNVAVAHALGAGIGRLLISAAGRFDDVSTRRITAAEPLALPLLSTRGVAVTSAGSGSTRVQKTVALIHRTEAHILDVCIDPSPERTRNCSKCDKCLRTLLTIEIAGGLERFCPHAFSLETYLAHRDDYVARVLGGDSAYDREIRAYAVDVNWRWRVRDRLGAGAWRAHDAVMRLRRAARSRLAALPGARAGLARVRARAIHRETRA
ncbi:hypothetical protein JF550_05040 [Microbacterium esteraromaticum]|uniref:Uncharacterized protein n=1 Tax=Microbacterium esteraromaticum TaxID=57043 RepID=A0A939DUM6_9MICO|nr:hypothetical protein [Microbacterium esteraromaticum]MBN8205317.1 hypothetical protein [Microbacterium esteraromaticum]MBN8415471.1 hypothetical protein [Microbacterium esteraromaticum]